MRSTLYWVGVRPCGLSVSAKACPSTAAERSMLRCASWPRLRNGRVWRSSCWRVVLMSAIYVLQHTNTKAQRPRCREELYKQEGAPAVGRPQGLLLFRQSLGLLHEDHLLGALEGAR